MNAKEQTIRYEGWLSTLADDPTPFDAFRAGFEAGATSMIQRITELQRQLDIVKEALGNVRSNERSKWT